VKLITHVHVVLSGAIAVLPLCAVCRVQGQLYRVVPSRLKVTVRWVALTALGTDEALSALRSLCYALRPVTSAQKCSSQRVSLTFRQLVTDNRRIAFVLFVAHQIC
jgi:hypothetical protein